MRYVESCSACPQPLPTRNAGQMTLTAFLACALLSLAAPAAHSQSPAASGTSPQPSGAMVAQQAAPSAGASAAQAPGSAAPRPAAGSTAPGQANAANTAPAPAGGLHQGIKVHGWWVIEVKNPDGKVTARREFENNIQSTGMTYLASLLSGNNSPGALSIMLNGAASTFTATKSPSTGVTVDLLPTQGPCVADEAALAWAGGSPASAWDVNFGGPSGGGPCLIVSPANSSGNAGILGSFCAWLYSLSPTINPCSLNLSVTGPTAAIANDGNSLSAGFSLMGSVPVGAASAGNITDVETVFESCDASVGPAACLTEANGKSTAVGADLVSVNLFTERTLDGIGTDPPQVPYSPGQTLNVTVTFSFQ